MKQLTDAAIARLHITQFLFKGDVTGNFDHFISTGGQRYMFCGLNDHNDIGITPYPNNLASGVTWKPKEEVLKERDWYFLDTLIFQDTF